MIETLKIKIKKPYNLPYICSINGDFQGMYLIIENITMNNEIAN
jgi:hypothetical protein